MTLSAQTKANRQNAKKSTGPKTKEGKAIVIKNAITHGAYVKSFMNEIEEADYQCFLNDLQNTYPSNNPIIKAQLERLAKTKTMADRIQRTISASFAISESSDRTDESLMDLLKMNEQQKIVAKEIVDGKRNIGDIINVRRLRVATELAHIDTLTFTSHDDFLYHTPHLCKFLFDEASNLKINIDKYVTNYAANLVSSDEITEKIIKILSKYTDEKIAQPKEEIDIEAPYPPTKTLETEIHKTSLANLNKATKLFKEELDRLSDTHHKVIAFDKLRKFKASPIAMNFDQMDKLLKFQASLQNQYSKILGELLMLINNKNVIPSEKILLNE